MSQDKADEALSKLSTDEKIKMIRMELLTMGFAAAKQIAIWKGEQRGRMPCPLCQKTLSFSIAETNGHMAARCETSGCIHAME